MTLFIRWKPDLHQWIHTDRVKFLRYGEAHGDYDKVVTTSNALDPHWLFASVRRHSDIRKSQNYVARSPSKNPRCRNADTLEERRVGRSKAIQQFLHPTLVVGDRAVPVTGVGGQAVPISRVPALSRPRTRSRSGSRFS